MFFGSQLTWILKKSDFFFHLGIMDLNKCSHSVQHPHIEGGEKKPKQTKAKLNILHLPRWGFLLFYFFPPVKSILHFTPAICETAIRSAAEAELEMKRKLHSVPSLQSSNSLSPPSADRWLRRGLPLLNQLQNAAVHVFTAPHG